MAYKKVKDFNYDDLSEYINRRACDGQWNAQIALCILDFMENIPDYHLFARRKRNEYVKNHIAELFDLETYPELEIDIETGRADW